jgi:hypothetical protein
VWGAIAFEFGYAHIGGFDCLHRDGWAIAIDGRPFSHYCGSPTREVGGVEESRFPLKGMMNKKILSSLLHRVNLSSS